MAESTGRTTGRADRPTNVIDLHEHIERRAAARRQPPTVAEAVDLIRDIGLPAVRAMDAVLLALVDEDDAKVAATVRKIASEWAGHQLDVALARQAAGSDR